MPKEYTKEELWKLYEKLPKELQEAIFSNETADQIGNIGERYELSEEATSELAGCVGDVLLGILPPAEFQETLEKELKLKKEVAKGVTREIERFIFYPVKVNLEELYKIEIAPPAQPTGITPPPEEKPSAPPPTQEKDIYKESIE